MSFEREQLLIHHYQRPLGITVIATNFILAGVMGALIWVFLAFGISPAVNFLGKISFFKDILFYSNGTAHERGFWLGLQVFFSAMLIVLAPLLLQKNIVSLILSRMFLIIMTCFLILTPYYPDKLLFIFTPLFAMAIFYSFHHKVEIYFFDIPKDYSFLNKNLLKSRLIILFSSIELFVSLLLLRVILWEWPNSGLILNYQLNKALTLTILIPKIELILLALIIFTACILTFTYRPIGRMINILLCALGFILGTFHLFFMQQPQDIMAKLHVFLITAGMLVFSFLYYFLLINPVVKDQFKVKADIPFAPRIIGLLSFGTYCFILLLFLRITSSYFPKAFENSLSTKKLEVKNRQILSRIDKFKILLKDPLP